MKRKLKKILCMSLVAVLCINHVTVAKQETVTAKSKENIKIAIDAGHQARGNSATEPIGPGSSTRKAKVAGGATGVATHVPEYKLTLAVAKKLQKELKTEAIRFI